MSKKASYCRNCGAHILWAQRYGAGPMPLDYEPVEEGDGPVYVIELSPRGFVYAVPASHRPEGHSALYASHLDTCPMRSLDAPALEPGEPTAQPYQEVMSVWVEPYGRWAIVWARYGKEVAVPTVFRSRTVRFDRALPHTILQTGKVVTDKSKWPQYVQRQLLAGPVPRV